jgi:TonB family protein
MSVRGVLLAALGAVYFARASGAAAVDPNAALEDKIRSADSVRVARVHEPEAGEAGTAGEDHLNDIVVEREGRVDAAWRASMAQAITEAMRRFAAPEICTRQPGARRIRFGIQFVGHDERATIILYLSEHCFEFWTARTFVGSAETHDLTPRILALLKQAFPSDTTVQHLDAKGMITCEDYHREHPEAKKAKLEGRVVVQVTVLVDGTVGDVKVLESVPGLDDAAIHAVQQWEFAPAVDCWGSPISATLVIPVVFSLE